jgi:PAS domain-containing protein
MSAGLTPRIDAIVRQALDRSGSLLYVVSQLVDAARQEVEEMWYRGELGINQQRRMLRELDRVIATLALEVPRPMRGERSCLVTAYDELAGVVIRGLLEEDGWKVRTCAPADLVDLVDSMPTVDRRVVVLVAGATVAKAELKPIVAQLKNVGSRLLVVVDDQWASAGGWHHLHADEYAGNAQTLILAARKLFSTSTTFSISEVAASLRVSPHAIRAWERRYKLPIPYRDSGQRRYTAEDIQLLLRIRHAATVRGRSLKLAALEAQGLLGDVDLEVVSASPVAAIEAAGPLGQPWRRVADAITDILMLIDARGSILDCNIATARFRNTVREKLQGTQLTDMVIEYDRAKAIKLYRPRPASRDGWELRMKPVDGQLTVVSFDSRVVAGRDAKLLGLRGHVVMREAAWTSDGGGNSTDAMHL